MFVTNKYLKWYYSIIENAKARDLVVEYTESHHIIPRSLGGDNSKKNIVRLLAREHFICHLLLPKITEGTNRSKMSLAAFMLATKGRGQQRYKMTNRWYQIIKERMSATKRGKTMGPCSDEKKKKIGRANTGKIRSEEVKKIWSERKKGKPWTEARRAAGRKVMTPGGIFNSLAEAERGLGLGANVVAYRVKTQPNDYYFINRNV